MAERLLAPEPAHRDVRMDGVSFVGSSATGDFAKALEPGNYSYCVMVRSGQVRLEIDFPVPVTLNLVAGDAVAVSGLTPHAFRSGRGSPDLPVGGFELFPMAERRSAAEVELVIGVAPSESLALGSLMIGPIFIGAVAHPDLSRRLWRAVEMLEDEYADASSIDRNLVVRRLAEVMLINMGRRVFAARRDGHGEAPSGVVSRPILQAFNAFIRAPDRTWTLTDLARVAGMSRTRFAEEFRQITGQTPVRIMSRMRLTAIARRLDSTALSVEAAAEEAGYSSSAAFVRAFQRAFGETPARWRRLRSNREESASRGRPSPRSQTRQRPNAQLPEALHRQGKDAS